MSSEELSLQNGLSVFQDDPLRAFNCGAPRTCPKTRELTGFIDDKMFSFPSSQGTEFRGGSIYGAAERRDPSEPRGWGNGGGHHSGDESDAGEDDDDEDDDDGDDDEGDGEETNNNISLSNNNNNNNINNNNCANESVHSAVTANPDKIGNGKAKHHPSFVGVSREMVVKDGGNLGQAVRESNYQNAVTIAEPDGDMYYSQYLQGGEGPAGGVGQKDVENGGGCGFSGRKDGSFSSESGESLRAILSDPVT